MSVSARTKQIVWVKAGGCCAICRDYLLAPGTEGADLHLVGAVAHIVASSEDGPRGAASLESTDRNSEPNLLLVCLAHHKVIDDDRATYTVDRLISLKKEHEYWVRGRLSLQSPWQTKLHYLYYLNLPRLTLLAALNGIVIDTSRFQSLPSLHDAGWDLNFLVQQFRNLFELLEVPAVDLSAALDHPESARGLIVSFDLEFRTKNIKRGAVITGSVSRDPHIYTRIGTQTSFLTIDPRWITTTTAFVLFRPSSGRGRFAGLGMVNAYDETAKRLMISPLAIGLPKSPIHEALFGNSAPLGGSVNG